jgi:hypothetical protein
MHFYVKVGSSVQLQVIDVQKNSFCKHNKNKLIYSLMDTLSQS